MTRLTSIALCLSLVFLTVTDVFAQAPSTPFRYKPSTSFNSYPTLEEAEAALRATNVIYNTMTNKGAGDSLSDGAYTRYYEAAEPLKIPDEIPFQEYRACIGNGFAGWGPSCVPDQFGVIYTSEEQALSALFAKMAFQCPTTQLAAPIDEEWQSRQADQSYAPTAPNGETGSKRYALTAGCPSDLDFQNANVTAIRRYSCDDGYFKRVLPNSNVQCENFVTAQIFERSLFDDQPNQCTIGNPCDPATGSKIETYQDYEAPGILFNRTWRSRIAPIVAFSGWASRPSRTVEVPPGALPEGWTHSYAGRVIFDGDLITSLFRPNGELVGMFETAPGSENYLASNASEIQVHGNASSNVVVYFPDGSSEIHIPYDCPGSMPENGHRLEQLVDASGRVTTVEYAPACANPSAPIGVTGPFGHSISFEYYDSSSPDESFLSAVVDSAGERIEFAYTTKSDGGRTAPVLATVTYQDDSLVTYLYEDNSNRAFAHITGVIDEESIRYATFGYDSEGRVTSTDHAGFEGWTFAYNPNETTTATDSNGNETIFNYQNNVAGGRAIRNATRNGFAHAFSNEGGGQNRVLSTTNRRGVRTTQTFGTGPLRRLESTVEAAGSSAGLARTTSYEYLNETSQLLTRETAPSACDDGTLRNVIVDTTYVPGTQLVESSTRSGWYLDDADQCAPIERASSLEYGVAASYTRDLGLPILIDGPRTDVADTISITYHECFAGAECGQLASVRNAAGHQWDYPAYDAHGRVAELQFPNGLRRTLAYDLRGRLRTVSDSDSNNVVRMYGMEYYDNGLIRRQSSPDGAFQENLYNNARLLTDVVDNHGDRLRIGYDAAGNRTSLEYVDSLGSAVASKTLTYDSFNHIDKVRRPNDDGSLAEWDYDFDATGLLVRAKDPHGLILNFQYDDLGRQTRMTDNSSREVISDYDINDNPVSAVVRANTGLPADIATFFTFDDFGQLVEETSPDRGELRFAYDSFGNMISKTDARGYATTYSYDPVNRPQLRTHQFGDTVLYEYDATTAAIGRLTRIIDPTGQTDWTYDGFGALTAKTQTIGTTTLATSIIYDNAGRRTAMTYPSGRVLTYAYDAERITGINIDGAPIVSSVAYAPFGALSSWAWGDGSVSNRTYNLRGKHESVDIAGNTQQLGYSPSGLVTSISASNGETGIGYDLLRRVANFDYAGTVGSTGAVFSSDPVLLTSIQTMKNESGLVPAESSMPWLTVATKNVSATGAKISLERGQVNTGAIVDKEKIGYVAIEPTTGGSFLDSLGNTITYEALTTPETILGWGTGCFETPFLNTYAAKPVVMASLQTHNGGDGGWLRRCKLNKVVLGLTVDEDKFGDSERRHNSAESAGIVAFSAAFDAQFQDPDGTSWGMEIAKVTLPSTATTPVFTAISFRQSYATKPVVVVLPNKSGSNPAALRIRNVTKNGFEVAQVEPAPSDGTHASMPIHYLAIQTGSHVLPDGTQIEVGRKGTRKQKHGSGVIGDEGWASIGFGETSGEPTMLTQSFAYDSNGNRTSVTDDLVTATYTNLLGSNRVQSISGSIGRTFSYDASGNVVNNGIDTYTYDDRGRLTGVPSVGATYAFNAQGQRVRKSTVEEVLFSYDERGRISGEYDGVGVPRLEMIWLNGAPIAAMDQAQTYEIHTDRLGTPRAVVSQGEVLWEWYSDAFGRSLPNDDVDGDGTPFEFNHRFPGQYYDAETGLHQNYFRTYDPSIGRYLESDPVGLDSGLNSYGYVAANPLTFVDPYGLFEIRAHYIKTPAGVETQFEIDFDPLTEAPGDFALWFAKKAKRLRNLARLLNTDPVGARRPLEDFVECGLYDAELQESYEKWFGDRERLSREDLLKFLNTHRDRSPEMSELYGTPENMLDQAEVNAKQHPFYEYIFDETRR